MPELHQSRTPGRRRTTPANTEVSQQAMTRAEVNVTGTSLMTRPFDTAMHEHMVAEAAYYRAERRGFTAGHEMEDWLAAEAEIDAYLYRMVGEGRPL